MELRPQDIVVVVKLLANKFPSWTYAKLGEELSLSASQVFRSVDRAEVARLLDAGSSLLKPCPAPPGWAKDHPISFPNRKTLKEFLIHGFKYAFPAHRGGLVRGMPTAHAT